jgi:putative phage-type endonuclease
MTVPQLLRLPLKVLRLEQNSAKWLKVRKSYRTASETPAVLGLSPWVTPGQLAIEKYGANPPLRVGNKATQHGHDNEPIARKAYEQKHGRTMKPACVTRGLFMASLDGWSKDRKIVLEVKSPFSGKNGHTWTHSENGEVEPFYYMQVQHQLMCAGAECCHFVVFDSKSGTFNMIEVGRNEEAFEEILDGWQKFEDKYA